MATRFRIVGSGHRRRLGDGAVRSIGAPGLRFTDVSGQTGMGIGNNGHATILSGALGRTLLAWRLSGEVDSAGVIGLAGITFHASGGLSAATIIAGNHIQYRIPVTGRMSARVPAAGGSRVALAATAGMSALVGAGGQSDFAVGTTAEAAVRRILRGAGRVSFSTSGVLSISSAALFREVWRDYYDRRAALVAAIDESTWNLAKGAHGKADANADAIVQTRAEVTRVDGRVTAEASRTTLLTGRVTNAETRQSAQGQAIDDIRTRQTVQGLTVDSQVQKMTGVQASITDLNGRTTTLANANQVLEARVSVNEQGITQAKSTWGVYLTAGNVISGVQSVNDGVIAEFNVMAHVFRVMSPAGSPSGMEWRSGYMRTWGGAGQAVIGSGFGPDNLMLFLGSNVGAPNATKKLAGLWADSAGNVGMSGTVESSLLKTSALSIESTRISTGGGRLAPFTLRDVSYRTLGSTVASMTQTVDEFVSPNWGTGYHPRRFAAHRMDVHIDVQVSGDKGTETCVIEVQYDGGAWNAAASVTMDCNYRGSFPMLLRYTTEDAWSTVAFRARTSQAHTQALSIRVEVMNYNASANAPGSTSGTASTGGGGGSVPPGGGGWCVDAETSVLPDGRFVRDLRTGDLVPCWNDDPETPAIVMLPVRAVALGEEDCFELVTTSGARLVQSRSTPMTLRDGRTAYTPDMLGEDVVVRRDGALEWEPVVALARKGVREVVKLNAGDRMYFAGTDPTLTIATHNMAKAIQLV